MVRWPCVIFLVVLGCGAPAASEPTTPTTPSGAGEPTSTYSVGDYVVYRYEGSFSDVPVLLHEEIVAVEGLRLTIDVRATRGEEQLHWIQVVTDSPENRDNNVIDELYEVVEGERVRLENENMADILRLYAWTLPSCGPPVAPLPEEAREVSIAGAVMSCTCQRQSMQCDGRDAVMTSCDCPDFLWTHGLGEVARPGEETPYWRMNVREHGQTGAALGASGAGTPHLRNCVLHSGGARGRRAPDGTAVGSCEFDAECIETHGGRTVPHDGFIRLHCEARACECTVERAADGSESHVTPFTIEEECTDTVAARSHFVERCMGESEMAEPSDPEG